MLLTNTEQVADVPYIPLYHWVVFIHALFKTVDIVEWDGLNFAEFSSYWM